MRLTPVQMSDAGNFGEQRIATKDLSRMGRFVHLPMTTAPRPSCMSMFQPDQANDSQARLSGRSQFPFG
jgi:hypothetical protein